MLKYDMRKIDKFEKVNEDDRVLFMLEYYR